MNIKSKLAIAGLGALLYVGAGTAAAAEESTESGPLAIQNFSSTIYITTDYVFRGISFSDDDAALQGSIDWAYNGFFAGVWGSSINGADYDQEFDYYGGYSNSWNGIDYTIMPIYYHFPASDDPFGGLENDQFEVWVTLGHGFSQLPLTPYFTLFYSWSPDFTLEDGTGNYINANIALTLPHGFGLDFGAGYQDVEGDGATGSGGLFCTPATGVLCDGYSYTHWTVGLTKSLKGFNFDVRYHDTNEDAETAAFYGAGHMDERVVFTVSRSF